MTKRKKKHSKQPSQVPPVDDRHYITMERPYYDKKRGRNRWLNRSETAEIIGVSAYATLSRRTAQGLPG